MQECSELTRHLSRIVGDPVLHARWLNTFSFLEYIGFRKIVKSQVAETLSLTTLGHAVEEGRHALRLKRLALKVGGSKFDSYQTDTLLCGEAAETYFQELDHYCSGSFSTAISASACARLTYLYVTWLVEVRALEVYELYQNVLAQTGSGTPVLQGLLAEEAGHLRCVEEELRRIDPEFSQRVLTLQKKEEVLYRDYLEALTKELSPLMSAGYAVHS